MSRWVRKMWAGWACLVLRSQTATAAGTGPGNNMTATRTGQGRSSTMPTLPLISLAGKSACGRGRGMMRLFHGLLTLPISLPRLPPTRRRHHNVCSATVLQLQHQPQGPFAFAAAANGGGIGIDGTSSPASSSIGRFV